MKRRFVVPMVGALLGALSCGEPPAVPQPPAPVEVPVVEEAPAVVEPAPVEAPSPLRALREGAKLRLPLVELAHLADRGRGDALVMELGTISGRKYILGGWRSGWSPRLHEQGDARWFEARENAARLFFSHKADGIAQVSLRMKAVKKSNKVAVSLNDTALGSVELGPDWQDYTFAVPAGTARDGENELLLRFQSTTRHEGRAQAGHVASAVALPAGMALADAPRGPAVGDLDLGDGARPALVAATPQRWTYRFHVPGAAPKLGLAWGARLAGTPLSLLVRADGDLPPLRDELSGEAATWQEKVVDLSAFAGQDVELTLSTGDAWPQGQVAGVAELALYSDAPQDGARAPAAPQTHAKNVLIYLIDTMRYDKFSFYNDKTTVATPNIDAFAQDATIFDHAYDNENWTKPSCATILSGLYPDTHKTKEDSSKLPERVVTISEHLRAQGFKTGSFIANGYVSNAFGFDQGWDFYTNYIREYKNTDVDRVVKDALGWIDKQKDTRFFAYVHTIDPHVPYSPPREWREKYWDKPYNGPIRAQSTGDQLAKIKDGSMKLSDVDKKYLEALYNGEVAFNDHHFGEMIQGLKDRGLYEDTVIILVADHGEEFWDHGAVGHGHSLYEEMIHAPMILRYPNKVPTGRRVSHVVQMVDVAPTLYDAAGVAPNAEVEGVSFLPVVDGIGEPRPYLAASDFLYGFKSFRAGRHKWITGGRGGKVFDVIADRNEKKDLLKRAHIGRAHVRGLAGLFLGAEDKTSWWEGAQGRERQVIEADSADIDADLRKQLESMGYIDGAAAPGAEPKKKDKE